jgi:hypothetical protein
MTCRHVKTLIDRVKRDSNFKSVISPISSTVGVQDSDIVDYFNDAQDHFVSMATSNNDTIFQDSVTFNIGSNATVNVMNSPLAMEIKIVDVKYRRNSTHNWVDIPKVPINSVADPNYTIAPVAYYIQNGAVYLTGDPTEGEVWIIWEKRPDYQWFPVAQVQSVTDSGTQITALTASYLTGANGVTFTDSDWDMNDQYFCVVDRYGAIKMRNVEFDTVSSGVFTFIGGTGFTYDTGETMAVDDYLVPGQNVSSHSALPREAERYFIYYAVEQICGTKGASFEKQTFLRRRKDEALAELINSYQVGDKDYNEVQIVDDELMLERLL